MPDPMPYGPTINMLERSLDLLAQRHQVLLANVANEKTPHSKAKDLEFRSTLLAAVRRPETSLPRAAAASNPRHLPLPSSAGGFSTPTEVDLPSSSVGLDRNTVTIEKTMAALHENGSLYEAVSQILSLKYKGLLSAIRDSR